MTTIAASQDPGSIRVAKSAGPFVGSAALVVAAASIGCLVIFETASFLGFAIHADSLHLALQTWDYSSHDYALEGFSMSRATSLVPDLVVYGAVQLATGSWRVASLAYGVLSLIGLAIAAGAVVRKAAHCDWRMATQTFLLLTLPILMLELPATAASGHMHLFLPTNHGGPFILALAALCVAWSWLERPATGKLLLLFVLVAVGVLSDPLFVISCVGPSVAALAYSLIRGRISLRTIGPILACLAIGTAAARGLDHFLVRDGLFSIEWPTVPAHARALLASVVELAAAAPLTMLLAYLLPAMAFLTFPLIARARGPHPRALDAAEYWWVVSASSVLATVFATSLVYEGTWHYRYMMPVLWWPIVWTTVLVVRALGTARSPVVSLALSVKVFTVKCRNAVVSSSCQRSWRSLGTAP